MAMLWLLPVTRTDILSIEFFILETKDDKNLEEYFDITRDFMKPSEISLTLSNLVRIVFSKWDTSYVVKVCLCCENCV